MRVSAPRYFLFTTPAITAMALLAACNHNPPHHRVSLASPPIADTAPTSAADAGALFLAGIDNARFAIARRDQIAAANDVAKALAYPGRLTGESSKVLPSETGLTSGPPRLTPFSAQTQLLAVQSDLFNGDLGGADRTLRAIQAAIPPRAVPADLPLIEARESLDLAVLAATTGQPGDLTTQLLDAEDALRAYAGGPYATQAKALAGAIDRSLTRPGGLGAAPQYQVSLLSGEADGWRLD
jgi:hypothetical protein